MFVWGGIEFVIVAPSDVAIADLWRDLKFQIDIDPKKNRTVAVVEAE